MNMLGVHERDKKMKIQGRGGVNTDSQKVARGINNRGQVPFLLNPLNSNSIAIYERQLMLLNEPIVTECR